MGFNISYSLVQLERMKPFNKILWLYLTNSSGKESIGSVHKREAFNQTDQICHC